MKPILRFLFLFLVCPFALRSQITNPVIKANFGVDGDLRSNYFNSLIQSGNDDWFWMPGTPGSGQFVIDTTGAAAIVSRYFSNPLSRRLPFYRNMRFPQFSVINNRLLLDAVMIRDYHGDDSTVFASGSNKNGDSPADWSCPVSQGIPDKNDILDMFVHVRRAGPNRTDSLWMFGGLSLDNTTGNRYFDFEMYQTDIYYDRPSQNFYGYGSDAGHTSWQFDALGNITRPGDIIFTAEYQSASLTNIEPRIWVDRASLSMTPASFEWTGFFDGASMGSQYGYASIRPISGGTFYTGLQCVNNTWGGPFGIILQDDSYATAYQARQFVEFSVNLTKLGLDPVTLLGGNSCGMPFRRILVKTRAANSFTAELKDFVGPFDFFLAPRADVATQTPYMCDSGSVSDIYVTNPVPTSVYEWSTLDGNIIGPLTGPVTSVDTPGTYIVTQYLQLGCAVYATDTIQVMPFPEGCVTLDNNLYDFRGTYSNNLVRLNWKVLNNNMTEYFEVQRSTDGINFTTIQLVDRRNSATSEHVSYTYDENAGSMAGLVAYYRIKLVSTNNVVKYSNVIRIDLTSLGRNGLVILPNPVKDVMQIQISSMTDNNIRIDVIDQSGKMVFSKRTFVQKGTTVIPVDDIADQPQGVYLVLVSIGKEIYTEKILHLR